MLSARARRFMMVAMTMALAQLVGACGDGGDADSDGGNGAEAAGCAEACKIVADCHGFADEAFGQSESECASGCSSASDAQREQVISCIDAAGCESAKVVACAI